jgi:hypothetical protein
MKAFFVKGTCFVAPLLVLLAYFEIGLRGMLTSYALKRDQIAALLDSVEVLAVGSSYMEQGLFPRRMSRPAYNLAFGGQDLYYDAALLDRYAPRAKRLRMVIMSVSFTSLEYRMSDAIEPWRTHLYSGYLDIQNESLPLRLKLEDKSMFVFFGPEKAVEYARQGFAVDLTNGAMDGGELDTDGSRHVHRVLTTARAAQSGRSRFDQDRSDIMRAVHFDENLAVLEHMVDSVLALGATPVIITPPVLPGYAQPAMATQSWRRMQDALAALSARRKVRYVNYFDDARFSPSDFVNGDHLNEQGAIKLTAIVDAEVVAKELRP